MSRPRAADDFPAIRARMEELRRERSGVPAETGRASGDLLKLYIYGYLSPVHRQRRRKSHRIISGDVIVDRLRQEQHLVAIVSGDVRHAGLYRASCYVGIRSAGVSTRSA